MICCCVHRVSCILYTFCASGTSRGQAMHGWSQSAIIIIHYDPNIHIRAWNKYASENAIERPLLQSRMSSESVLVRLWEVCSNAFERNFLNRNILLPNTSSFDHPIHLHRSIFTARLFQALQWITQTQKHTLTLTSVAERKHAFYG